MADISKQDSARMRRLAQEGKQISRIVADDFPHLDYSDVYIEVYGAGERSSRGIKKMISIRLNKLVDAARPERRAIVEELHELVWHLYENHKTNQRKIDTIRKSLQE
jgi:hypothetical protein